MDRLLKKVEEFLKRYVFMKRWRKVLAVMTASVVFLTTYAMILPAITLETDSTEEVGLISEEPAADSVSGNTVEELAVEQEESDTPIEAEQEETGPTVEVAEEMTEEESIKSAAENGNAEEEPTEEIALITEDTRLTFKDEEGKYTVYADFGEEACRLA